ncbi:MAG: PilZ domain-containing protein [Candidatus Omnitrophica bacterium]|nr:PilZ domain-containing protein [Candidatus Omnitrophota bacterium]
MPTFEYRKYYRADAVLKVKYRTIKEPVISGVAFSKNISSVGISMLTSASFEKGAELELNVYLKEGERPLFAKGKVLWLIPCQVGAKKNKKYYTVGVQIYEMSPEHAIMQSDFVKDVITAQSDEESRTIIKNLEEEELK